MKLFNAVTPLALLFAVASCNTPESDLRGSKDGIDGRYEWQLKRLADPNTGKIPKDIRKKELAFAAGLPSDKDARKFKSTSPWQQVGPYNIGGRTRALAIDVDNENILLAGGVSGGMWRSEDQGTTWTQVTGPQQHHSVTCIAQDRRPGKTNTWYYGSGEGVGNSASKSFSAYYSGNGIYKSTDNGKSWNLLQATSSGEPQTLATWDIIWNIATDHTVTDSNVVYAALNAELMKSTDGGKSWKATLTANSLTSSHGDVAITEKGVKYAAFSSDNRKSVFRSLDGDNWTNITPSNFPSPVLRIVLAVDPNFEDQVYVLAETPDHGQLSDPDNSNSESNSLWRYTYKSGDGSGTGGNWKNLSGNIPSDHNSRRTYKSQGGYDMLVAVKPDDPNVVFIGGTNLFRSNSAFTTSSHTTQIGGYNPGERTTFEYRYPKNHPDYHVVKFLKSSPSKMIVANDGGVYKTQDCMADTVAWEDLNRGYYTTQFYTVAVDRNNTGSQVVIGGMQDNSSAWTNTNSSTEPWTTPSGGDGAYCAVAGNGIYYFSHQYSRTYRMLLDENGNRVKYERVDPDGANQYLFINPFILDPLDSDIMYMAERDNIWRHDNLSSIALTNGTRKHGEGWSKFLGNPSGQYITALAATHSDPEHKLYIGTNSINIFSLENADYANTMPKKINNNIAYGGWTSDIAVDPRDGNKLIVVYSNYNTYSLYYSKNGGDNWRKIAGNLESEIPDGGPQYPGYGSGPSCRSAAIVPLNNGETAYFVGTSTGLYATKQLNGDSTVWVQQATETIGNVVVDAIDFRPSDGFMAAATHGRGVFSAFITSTSDVTGIEDLNNGAQTPKNEIRVFPNPAQDHINIAIDHLNSSKLRLTIYDVNGKMVEQGQLTATGKSINHRLPVHGLNNGYYSFSLRSATEQYTGRFLVGH